MLQLRSIRISLILTALMFNSTHAQITWKNVPITTMPDTSRQMDSARDSINNAFEQLQNVIKTQQDTNSSNNTQDYLDALYAIKTVNDLLANQEALERKRIGYGTQINRDVARNAFDARLSTLMQQERTQVGKQGFGTQQLVESQIEMSQTIAIVNGKAVPSSRFELFLKQIVLQEKQVDTPQLRGMIKDELVNREILTQEADKLGLGNTKEIKEQLEIARQGIVIRSLVTDFLKKNPIKDEEIKAEYDKFKASSSDKEYHARHILVETEEEARTIIGKLKAGTKFEDLAKQSKDPGSAANGGDLDWATPATFVKPFSDAMIALKKGDITELPIKTQFGFHVIKLEDTRAAKIPSLEEVKPQITELLQQKKLQAFQEGLRKKAKIQ